MSNRNELKVYQGNIVYLNNGDNFELKFFNPLREKIGVEIILNGIKKGDSYLVLNPGQDVLLDRFLDEQRKMLFETYVVNGENKEAVKAIEENGVITFNFYKEYNYYNNSNNEVKIKYDFPEKPYCYTNNISRSKKSKKSKGGGSGIYGSTGSLGLSGSCGETYTRGITTDSLDGDFTTTSIYNLNSRCYSDTNVTISTTNDIPFDKDYWIPTTSSEFSANIMTSSFDPLETGRVEMGDKSNQNLREVNAQFMSDAFVSVTFKMLPYSAKNKTVGEIRQYCPECGYRLRKESWKFCPKCGEKL